MHVDVSEILQQGEGEQRQFQIENELPELNDVSLTQPLSGRIHLIRTNDGLAASGQLQASVQLECDRCLKTFVHPLELIIWLSSRPCLSSTSLAAC